MSDDNDFKLIDPTPALKKADKIRKDFGDTEVKELRIRAKNDLYFFAKTVLGFDKLSPNLHGNLCSWMKQTNEDRFRLQLMPRGHYKTTILTIADGLQIALPDDIGNQPYPRNLGPDVRILFAHEVIESAQKNLKAVTDKIYGQEFLLALFPELLPNKGDTVNASKLQLPRESEWPETTFSTMGVGSSGQGNHFDHQKIDDIVGLEAMKSEAEFKTAVNWVRDLPGMFVSQKSSHVDFTGVRYGMNDIYSLIMEDYEDDLKIYTRSIYERNEKGEKELIFPEEVTWKDIARLQKDMARFNAQYMNNPAEMEGEFSMDWERYYEKVESPSGRVYEIIMTDELGTKKRIDTRNLDILVLVDPAMKGYSGIVVTGTDRSGNVFILDAIQERMEPEETIAKLFKLNEIWNPRAVVIESVLFSGLWENLLKREMQIKRTHFRIIMVTTKQKQKEDRVRGLRIWFTNLKIFFHSSQKKVTNDGLVDQYRAFPAGNDYHALDALAYGPEVWRSTIDTRTSDERDETFRKFSERRSRLTGYSPVKYA